MAEEESFNMKAAKELKRGSFVMIDGIPCRVVEIELSAPGKHGSAKARITAVGIFDNTKRTLLKPGDADVEVPEIKKRRAQVVSISESTAQLMDMETYEMYDAPIPEEIKNSLKAGSEVEMLESMGKRIITRIVGGA